MHVGMDTQDRLFLILLKYLYISDVEPGRKRKRVNSGVVDESNLGRFKFTAQGTRVAVYYEDGVGRMECAIGEVVKVESVDSGVVNFMESTGKNSYRWPGSPYIDTISCRYVVDSDFGMTTATGRIWNIEKPKQLAKTFTAYLKKFVTV